MIAHITALLTFVLTLTQLADTEPRFQMCWKICRPSGIGLCPAACKLTAPTCTPCVYGCVDNVCNDEPYTDEDGLPVAAVAAMDAGVVCRATDAGGECEDGYAWACGADTCVDTDGGQWRPVMHD